MEWGHTQNLLSVIVGLNIAYYSFKEIRAPELARFVASVDDLTGDIEGTLNDIRAVEEWECLDGQKSNIADSQLEYRLIDVQLSTNILKLLTIAKLENPQLKLWENNFGSPLQIDPFRLRVVLSGGTHTNVKGPALVPGLSYCCALNGRT